jgi:hypothetical protein
MRTSVHRRWRAGGQESEQFFAFANAVSAPAQLAWSGLVLLWQACVLLAVFCFDQLSRWVAALPNISATVATASYLTWLVINIRELWSDEFH